MFNFKGLTIGADPEVFFLTKDKKPFSAEGLVGGTKAEPRPIGGAQSGLFVQEDNVSAEFNIPPAGSARDFSNSINKALKYLNKIAKDKNLELGFYSSLHFDKIQLDTPHAQTLGCEPDIDAWTGNENPRPKPPESLRTAAGHVHVGWADPVMEERQLLLRSLDLFLGVPSIVATKKNERRSLYGKAGACRIKPYGVEYRTLDNFWIEEHKNRAYVFDQCMLAAHNIKTKGSKAVSEILEDFKEEIIGCINDHDQDLAVHLCSKFNIDLFPTFAV